MTARPQQRPLRRLPTLEPSKPALERCVFCPKLCRSACPVSDAEPRETVTPWGKMSAAYLVARGSEPASASMAAPAWACTGCFGCREQCDHHNDVTSTLFAARSALADEGLEPPGARRVLEGFEAKTASAQRGVRALASLEEVDARSDAALLLGCAYTRSDDGDGDAALEIARDATRATAALLGRKVSLVDVCCGAPLLYAGSTARFAAHRVRLASALRGKTQLVVVDAGCASTLRVHHAKANAGDPGLPAAEAFASLAARELTRLRRVDVNDLATSDGPVRWHDPCQLGRGLGIYEEPRAVLTRALGRAPDEFPRRRGDARCSGAGGLVPVTMPETSAAMSQRRVDEHEAAGGGTIVTACASSRRRFAKTGARVVDLASVVARALGL